MLGDLFQLDGRFHHRQKWVSGWQLERLAKVLDRNESSLFLVHRRDRCFIVVLTGGEDLTVSAVRDVHHEVEVLDL